MTTVLDQSTDITSQMRHIIQQLHGLPPFVKSAADVAQFGDPETQSIHLYADQTKRLFPCHTKAATWLSAAYFAHQQSQYPENMRKHVHDNIVKSAAHFGIAGVVSEIFTKAAKVNSYEDAATPDTAFALTWSDAAGTHRRYPLRNPSEVKVAAAWFNENWKEFDFNTRHSIAQKVFAKIAELQVEVDDTEQIEKSAGFGFCQKTAMVHAWKQRALLTKQLYPEYSKQAEAVATAISGSDIDLRDCGLRVKMASNMDDFDAQTNLRRYYADGAITWPEQTLFETTEKVASDFLNKHILTTSGAVYAKGDLERLTAADIGDWMGRDIMQKCGGLIADLNSVADVLPTLDAADAKMFDKLAAARGIKPIGFDHASPTGVTQQELTEFAAAYSAAAGAAG